MPEKEFRKLMIRLLRNNEKQCRELNEKQAQGLEILKRSQNEILEMKNSIDHIKNTVESLGNRIDEIEDRISEFEDKLPEIIQSVQTQEEEIKKLKNMVRNLQDSMKRCNVLIIGVPEGVGREIGLEAVFNEIVSENFKQRQLDNNRQIQQIARTLNRVDRKRNSPRHIVATLSSVTHKEQILKCAREKRQITYRDKLIRLTPGFSLQTLQARRQWHDIFQVLKDKQCQPRILYPAKLSFMNEGEIKIFQDKQKL